MFPSFSHDDFIDLADAIIFITPILRIAFVAGICADFIDAEHFAE